MKGTTISHYRVVEQIGRGGMGVVYKAEDTKLNRTVALKLLPPHALASEDDRARFYREARAAAALNHANIAHVYEIDESFVVPAQAGTSPGSTEPPPHAELRPFIAMEYVDGESLATRIDRGPLSLKDAVSFATQIAQGLQAAHESSVVHRDIKSGNIMLTSKGEVKVLDFGLAKTTASTKLTQMGSTLGTVAYMSPEQARGEQVDGRTDIWSLGVIIYEMIVGRMPFAGDYEQAVVYTILNEDPEPLTAVRTGVPMQLEAIVEKCLRKSAAHRYQTAADLIADLQALSLTDSRSRPVSGASGMRKATRQTGRRGRDLRVGFVTLAAIAGFVTAWFLRGMMDERSDAPSPLEVTSISRITPGGQGELFPALSPDGQMVAFVGGRENRLFVRQFAGGRVLRLAEELSGPIFAPRWTPDQTAITFQSGGVIYNVPALGGAISPVVTPTRDPVITPAWAPDGDRLAYSDDASLRVMTVSSRDVRTYDVPEAHSPSWSPDGRRIALMSGNSYYHGLNLAPSAVAILDVETGEWQLTTGSSDVNASPVWSSDGSGIFFVSNEGGGTDVYWQKIEGLSAVGVPHRVSVGLRAHTLDVSTDRRRLVVSQAAVGQNVHRVRLRPGVTVDLSAAEPLTSGYQMVEGVAVSPDGEWLAYDSNVSGNSDIYIRRVEGGDVRRVTSDPADEFVYQWSADGKHLSFHSFASGNRGIYTVSVDDLFVEKVVDTSVHERYPAWSPDGNAIAYYYGDETVQSEVRLIRRSNDGGWGSSEHVTDVARTVAVRWSPNGREIAIPERNGIRIYSVPDKTTRSIALPEGYRPGGLQWSRDGKTIFFSVALSEFFTVTRAMHARGGEGIWSVPAGGGVPVHRLNAKLGFLHIALSGEYVYFTTRDIDSDLWMLEF